MTYSNEDSPRDIQPSHQWREGELGGVEDNEIIAICDCAPMEPMVALISQSADFVLRNLLLTQISSTADIAILIISNPRCAGHQQLAKLIGRVVFGRGSCSWGRANDNSPTPQGTFDGPIPMHHRHHGNFLIFDMHIDDQKNCILIFDKNATCKFVVFVFLKHLPSLVFCQLSPIQSDSLVDR